MASATSAARAARNVDPPTEPGRVGELPAPRSVQLRLFGTFALTRADSEAVAIASPRAQSLLAWLALHRDAPQPRRLVSFLLWPDSSEAQAHNNLRQLLHQLRRTWPDADRFLTAGGGVLALAAGPELAVDVDDYERAVAEALAADAPASVADTTLADGAAGTDRDTEPAEARLAFERAADLYRGDLLPGVFDEWILPERARLNAQHQRVLERLIGMLERLGDYRAAIERGNQRLRLDPLDERVVRWAVPAEPEHSAHGVADSALRSSGAGRPTRTGVAPGPGLEPRRGRSQTTWLVLHREIGVGVHCLIKT